MANERQNEQSLQRSKDLAAFQEGLAAKRMETVEAIRLKREKDHQAELMRQSDAVDDTAQESRNSRNLKGIIAAQSGVGQDVQRNTKTGLPIQMSPAASEDEMKALLADPKNRKIYEDAGYIPRANPSDLARDKVDASRTIGADPLLRKEYQTDYAKSLDQERAATVAAMAERKQSETERSNAAREDSRAKRDEAALNMSIAAMTRADKSGNAKDKAEAMLNLNTVVSTQQKTIKDNEERLRLTRAGSPEETALKEEIKLAKEISSKASSAIKKRLDGPDSAEEPKEKPAPAKTQPLKLDKLPSGSKKIGTSNGRAVYEAPDGYRFIE